MQQRWQYGCALFAMALCGCSSSSATGYGSSGSSGSAASTGAGNAGGSGSGAGSGSSSGSATSGDVAASGSATSGSDEDATTSGLDDASASNGDGGSSGKDSGTAPVTYPPLKFSAIGTASRIMDNGQFYFTEGPVWDPTKNVLYFTDINAKQGATTGGAIYTLTLPNTFSVLLQPSGNADGLGLDPQGNIIAAGYGSRDIWILTGTSTMSVLVPCSSGPGTCFNSMEINTPDDIVARADGVIYFTDPTFGTALASGTFGLSGAQGVYRLTKDGVLHLEDSTTNGPNGVNFSPDQKTLYVSYTTSSTVSKFTVAADGSLSKKTAFASATFADSMCVDAGGNVYVATSSGLAVFSPAGGAALGTIAAGGTVTNCAFGGPDQKTLFITSHTGLPGGTPTAGSSFVYKVDNMPVPGVPGQN
jgi:gluconolactonase